MKIKTDRRIRQNRKQQKQGKARGKKDFYKTRCCKIGHFNEKNKIYDGH